MIPSTLWRHSRAAPVMTETDACAANPHGSVTARSPQSSDGPPQTSHFGSTARTTTPHVAHESPRRDAPVMTHAAQPPREAATPIKETDLSACSPSPSRLWLWPPQPGLPPSLNYTTAQIGNNE